MILMNDFAAEPAALQEEERTAVERVLRSGRFILGPEGQQFEEAWARFCGVGFCIGLANGMEAIELGLRALQIGAGDEVITTSMTAMATIMAILHAGATPVLADIERETALLDIASVKRCLTKRTKAVLLVHLYGQVPDMTPWIDMAGNARIQLLEDAAQAHGAVRQERCAGSFGKWGAFSFYPTKNLGAKGDAGAFVTDSRELADRVKTLRNYGTVGRYEHLELGLNSRLDELQAAILRTRLAWLDRFNRRRQQIAARYHTEITHPQIELPFRPSEVSSHVHHLFVVRSAERDRLEQFLQEKGVKTLIHYPIAAHRQPFCAGAQSDPAGLLNAERHAAQCLSLPCHPQLSEEDVTTVVTAVNAFR